MLEYITQHKFVSVVIIIVIVLGAWYGLDMSSSSDSTSSLATSAASGGGDDSTVKTLLALRAVNLNGTIFSDPVFRSMKDFTTQITPEPVGRPNPFDSLSQNTAAAPDQTASSRGANLFAPKR